MWLRWALCTLRWIEVEMCREMSEARNANAATGVAWDVVAWRTVEYAFPRGCNYIYILSSDQSICSRSSGQLNDEKVRSRLRSSRSRMLVATS